MDAAEAITGKALWTGRILSTLAVLFMAMDGAMKILKPPFVVAATVKLGYPEAAVLGIGVAEMACLLAYVVPATSLLGAILLTAFLGGATASNVRAGTGWFNTLFPVGVAMVVWVGLWLRSPHLRVLLRAATKRH